MRLIHSHDPDPEDQPQTVDEIKALLSHLYLEMWEFAELAEFAIAHTRELAMDRWLLTLAAMLPKDEEQAA